MLDSIEEVSGQQMCAGEKSLVVGHQHLRTGPFPKSMKIASDSYSSIICPPPFLTGVQRQPHSNFRGQKSR